MEWRIAVLLSGPMVSAHAGRRWSEYSRKAREDSEHTISHAIQRHSCSLPRCAMPSTNQRRAAERARGAGLRTSRATASPIAFCASLGTAPAAALTAR
jgi:hypothetical protein